MPLTSVSGMHVTGRLKLSDPPSEGTPRRVTQLSQYGGNLTIVLEVQFHGFHAFFTRVHGHPPFWSRILSAYPNRRKHIPQNRRNEKSPPLKNAVSKLGQEEETGCTEVRMCCRFESCSPKAFRNRPSPGSWGLTARPCLVCSRRARRGVISGPRNPSGRPSSTPTKSTS